MLKEKLSYFKSAESYLKEYYEKNAEDNIFSGYQFISRLANEAERIAESVPLVGIDYQSAIVATWFRYAGVSNIVTGYSEESNALLSDFFKKTDYPQGSRETVKNAIFAVIENRPAYSIVQEVVCDAIYSQLASGNLMENIILLKEEINRVTGAENNELYYSKYVLSLFIKTSYYTKFGIENYEVLKNLNFQTLEKRVKKLEEKEKAEEKTLNNKIIISSKETDDLFKIAFRNYNHLVSVADSKAALLIKVNSVIISFMLAFVIRRIDKNIFLLWPTSFLLIVSAVTIFLSILASRPQKNALIQNKDARIFQKFFFGSFDMIDTSFHKVKWEEYHAQLSSLFSNSKEEMYLEAFKESFNVRKVLSKKFSYLAIAYWVFIIGLLLSIIAFLLSIESQTIVA